MIQGTLFGAELDAAPAEVDDETRKKFAVHRTPMGIVRQVVGKVAPLVEQRHSPVRRILIPSAGDGRWGLVCRERWPDAHVTAVEPRPEEAEGLRRFCDAVLTMTIEQAQASDVLASYDLVIDNPPFSLPLTPGAVPDQATAMAAFLPLRHRLRHPWSRLVLYWLTELGQRSQRAVDLFEEHLPIEQWRIPLPVSHDRTVDMRNYSVWHWSPAADRPVAEWRTSVLPVLDKVGRRSTSTDMDKDV